MVEDRILPNDRLDEFKSIVTRTSICGVDIIGWDAKGPGFVWEIALVALEVMKRDKEKHGTCDNHR